MMPGWDGFSIPGWFSRHYDAPVLVDNDVNIMALGEHWTHWRDMRAPALREDRHRASAAGSSPAAGSTAARRARRATSATSGSAGHDDVVCRCGNVGCLEAVAGGRALAARADRAPGCDGDDARATSSGSCARASRWRSQAVRDAGRYLGEVLAECINFFNPGAIVIGGDLAEAHQQLLAGVREVVVRPLAADGHARSAAWAARSSATARA